MSRSYQYKDRGHDLGVDTACAKALRWEGGLDYGEVREAGRREA